MNEENVGVQLVLSHSSGAVCDEKNKGKATLRSVSRKRNRKLRKKAVF